MRPGAGTISPARNASGRAPVRLPTLPSQLPRARSGVSEGDQREGRRGEASARPGRAPVSRPAPARRQSSLTHSQGWRSAEKEVSCGLQSTPSLSRSRPTRPGRWIAPAQKERRSSPSQRVVIGGNECADVPGRGRPGQREYIAKGWLVCPAIIDARW
jgi:hypothetical protein